jgi:hypothetical protein
MPQRRSAAGRGPEPRGGGSAGRPPQPPSLASGGSEDSLTCGFQRSSTSTSTSSSAEQHGGHQPPRPARWDEAGARTGGRAAAAIAETEAACVDLRESGSGWILCGLLFRSTILPCLCALLLASVFVGF